MSKILITYGSAYGQTERVARKIAGVLKGAGHVVEAYKGDQLPGSVSPDAFDGVLVAASVLKGRHQAYIRDFVRRHVVKLNSEPSAFVSVCGAAGSDPPQAQAYIDALLRETGWRPTVTRSFTGAVAYTQYGWVVRWVMKQISRQKGLPTDTSKDWDFTEWPEVERFAADLAVLLGGQPLVLAEG